MNTPRGDVVWAATAGAVAFAVYVRTLAPGLVAVVDTPMFQFIGRVLGVAHNPGYPLYVLLTHPISRLPIGSLAYRINLVSAVLGALTVSLTFLLARRLGCRVVVSLGAALGLAFGQVFWSQAVIAEVYTLHTAILAGVLLCLLAWSTTRRDAYFFAAVALFAAGLGNHTTIVAFAPGVLVYGWLKDRRFVFRWRTLVVCAALLAAGVLQYGFVLLRSRQPGAYVESPARTVPELVDVMLARQFGDRLFAFDWSSVVSDRLPWLVSRVLAVELTVPGLVLAAIGAGWMLRRRFPEALLLLPGACLVIAFALNYRVVDTPVFVIPAFLVLWVMFAVAVERTVQFAARRRWAAVMSGLVLLAVPAWNLTHNFALTDRSRDTDAAVHFDALFEALPARAAFVHEDFLVDRMVRFKQFTAQPPADRRVLLVPRDPRRVRERFGQGFTVLAFNKSARQLRRSALAFSFQPLPLVGGSLAEYLGRLRDGSVVALAVPARHAGPLSAADGSLEAIGGPRRLPATASNLALVGARGARAALVRQALSDRDLDITVDRELAAMGVAAPFGVQIQANAREVAIRRGSRDIVRTTDGAAVAVWNPEGRLVHACVLRGTHGYRVPLPSGSLAVYPLGGDWAGQRVDPEWTDVIGSLRSGTFMVRLPPGTEIVVFVADDGPLRPRDIDRSPGAPRIQVTTLTPADASLEHHLRADGATDLGLDAFQRMYRLRVAAPERSPGSVLVALGGVPSRAMARVTVSGPSREAEVFHVDTQGLLRTPDDSSELLLMARDDQAQLTGHGWSAVEADRVSPYRWMTATEARFVLPVSEPHARRIVIQARRDGEGGPQRVALRVNGHSLSALRLASGWNRYEWLLPAGMLASGANEVTVVVDRLGRSARGASRGIAVTDVRLIHAPSSPE